MFSPNQIWGKRDTTSERTPAFWGVRGLSRRGPPSSQLGASTDAIQKFLDRSWMCGRVGDAGIGWARRNATSPTIRYRTTISTPIDIDMSLPHSIAGPSKKRKHSSAESGDKGVGLGGIDPANLDGPQPAPAYRDRSQGQKFDDTRKVLFLSTF